MSASIFQILEGSPQVLFPQGLQEDFLVTNTGITSVYLDMDSSINKSSYRLRPLSSMVWSGGKPLWAVADKPPSYRSSLYLTETEAISSAQITVNRNNANSASVSSSYTQVIANIPAYKSTSPGHFIRFENLEVGHLETVTLEFQLPDEVSFDPAKQLLVYLYWVPEDVDTITTGFSPILLQKILSWYPDPQQLSGAVSLTIPVRGPRLLIIVDANTGFDMPHLANIRLTGRSAKSKLQVAQLFAYHVAKSNTLAYPPTSTDDAVSYLGGYDFEPLYMMAKSSTMTVTLRTHAAVTVAGKLVLLVDGVWYDDLTIPVGAANAMITKTFNVPMTGYLQLSGVTVPTPAPSGANYSLTVLFKDGATL